MASNTYTKRALTGGSAGALDNINGADLSDDDRAIVITDTVCYHYRLDGSSGESESSPEIISPDSNAGSKRWVLNHPFRAPLNYETLTDMKLQKVGLKDNQLVYLMGHTAIGDAGEGWFYWDASSTDTNDDGTIVKATNITTGRFLRVFSSVVCSGWWGFTESDIQAAIDYAYNTSGVNEVNIAGGTTTISSGLTTYADITLNFAKDSVLENDGATFMLRTSSSDGAAIPTGMINKPVINNLTIDMKDGSSVGLLIECCQDAEVNSPYIYDMPSGTFGYDDGNGNQTYPKSGIMIKGITSTYGCYYTRVVKPYIKGDSDDDGNVGIWLGTSLGENTQKANFNKIYDARCLYMNYGIYINKGNDACIYNPELSACDTGIYDNSGRTFVTNPYLECREYGVYCSSDCYYQIIFGSGNLEQHSTGVGDFEIYHQEDTNNINRWYKPGHPEGNANVRCKLSSDYTASHDAAATLPLAQENWDTGRNWDVTNYEFTATEDGFHRFTGKLTAKTDASWTSGNDIRLTIYTQRDIGEGYENYDIAGFRGTNIDQNFVHLDNSVHLEVGNKLRFQLYMYNYTTTSGTILIHSSQARTQFRIVKDFM